MSLNKTSAIPSVSKKTVLLAMDDSVQSAVSAYLLKKQGLNCIGISFVFCDQKPPSCLTHLVIKDLKTVKKICTSLDITHYAVDAKDLFKDAVVDQMVAAKLSGRTFDPIYYINKIMFDLLLLKMELLKADYISSGHFARIILNQKQKKYFLAVANDLENDESYRLCLLNEKHLEKMILPLSDIQFEGVLKISALINYQFGDATSKKSLKNQLLNKEEFYSIVVANSSPSLCASGEVKVYGEDGSLGEHLGIYRYFIGQNKLKIKGEGAVDPKLEVVKIDSHRDIIYLYSPDKLKHTHCKLHYFFKVDGLDISLPLQVFIKGLDDNKKIECILYIKNNFNALVEFLEERSGLLTAGTFLVFYDRRDDGGRILAHGIVEEAGFYLEGRFRTLPETRIEKEILSNNKPLPIDNNLKF